MRLMSENSESSLQKYARFKDNPNEWQAEMDSYGLTEQEQAVVRKYYDYVSGVPPYQED